MLCAQIGRLLDAFSKEKEGVNCKVDWDDLRTMVPEIERNAKFVKKLICL